MNEKIHGTEETSENNGFYCEPLSEELCQYISGVSFVSSDDYDKALITYDDLMYVHVMHIDFNGNPAEGELICNKKIANDLLEIFEELYKNKYEIEKIKLIDEYGADDVLSMADNNSSCFNYRFVAGTKKLSNHAYGMAVDINPFYNPYITYNKDKTPNISPPGSEEYADRSKNFPHKIDSDDLCVKLFKDHGFRWGGDWKHSKDYQHFD
ncbi:MAG: M15 family metallopeptidase, partial [Lachnospiraceae bacterium]|nr:M15 family metallopeptidase [Lachnospiraceae bacterium]